MPKRYKRNAINGDLHRAKRIATDFENEKRIIRKKFLDAGFPPRFVDSVFRDFGHKDFEYLQPGQSNDNRTFHRINLPFCQENEKIATKFINRLDYFTGDTYKFFINWSTRKIRSLFPLKDKTEHRTCIIYQGTCECNENYIGETERNDIVRFNEHEDIRRSSEPARHLSNNVGLEGHVFTWRILRNAPLKRVVREIVEAFYIRTLNPSLNIDAKSLILFRNGVT